MSVTFSTDTLAPEVAIVTPVNGNTLTTPPTTVTGTAEPGAEVVVFFDGEEIGTVTADEDGNWSIPVSDVGPGEHTVTATATDAVGNSTTVDITFTVAEEVVEPETTFILEGGGCATSQGSGSIVMLFLLGFVGLLRRRRMS
jgi:uncharacterized protein (TIGR03382 family)